MSGGMYTLRATQKLRTRLKQPLVDPAPEATTVLGDWYANVLLWRPQAVLLVSERTLLPVVMPLAPASSLAPRFNDALRVVLAAHGAPAEFIAAEIAEMSDVAYARTASRSILGVMNDMVLMAKHVPEHMSPQRQVELSLWLAQSPFRPLYPSHGSPDRELGALIDEWTAAGPSK